MDDGLLSIINARISDFPHQFAVKINGEHRHFTKYVFRCSAAVGIFIGVVNQFGFLPMEGLSGNFHFVQNLSFTCQF
jgi:hypothetical protein